MCASPPSRSSGADDVRRERLLYGGDPVSRIVAVERAGNDRVVLYRDNGPGPRSAEVDAFRPWILAERSEPWAALRPQPEITLLAGDHAFRYLVQFENWQIYLDAMQAAQRTNESHFRVRSAVEQYLILSGRTLFRDMDYGDLRRLQLDIETLGLNPTVDGAMVVAAALRTSAGDEVFLTNTGSEADLIERITAWIVEHDPDVIEGHNVFNFDIPFLVTRAQRHNLQLNWGRNGSPVRVREGQSRFKVAALSLPYTFVHIHGRDVIDTYQQVQRWDIGGMLNSYALKQIMATLFPEQDREIIPGEDIRMVWERGELDRLEAYNLADVRDVDTLSRMTMPTEFYQTQIVPRSFQSVATGGTGEKINDIMVRAYLMDRHSVPRAEPPVPYPGGHTELLATGAFTPVVKCDVESLYPSIMLADRIEAKSDTLNASLPMLAELTRRRLEAKAHAQAADTEDRVVWNGLQASFKVLINSFYGYLGYGGGLFNDFDAAARVTIIGQQIIKQVVRNLEASGATPIEVDTDGVYFVPPGDILGPDEEEAYIARVGADLPKGIRLAHDGSYDGMLSLKLKNYALLKGDQLVMRGSSLRGRQLERVFRRFLESASAAYIRRDHAAVRSEYFALAERIRAHDLDVRDFSQWRMLNAETIAKTPRLHQLLKDAQITIRSGERVEIYERQDGRLALAADYADDESTPYLLRRLRDTAERFRPIYADDAEFDATFPLISARTDLEAAKTQDASKQLSLFG